MVSGQCYSVNLFMILTVLNRYCGLHALFLDLYVQPEHTCVFVLCDFKKLSKYVTDKIHALLL